MKPPELTITLAASTDLPRILDISNWAAEHTSANYATAPESLEDWTRTWQQTSTFHPWLVASTGNDLVGFAKSSPYKSRGAYRWTAEVSVYVSPEHHGRGVGSALYRALLPLLRAQGYVTLMAGISDGNAASERLHAKAGFVRCGTFHRAGWKFDRWHDVGFWELHLQPASTKPSAILPVAECFGNNVRENR